MIGGSNHSVSVDVFIIVMTTLEFLKICITKYISQNTRYSVVLQKFELETSNMVKDKKQLQFEVDRLLSTVKALSKYTCTH